MIPGPAIEDPGGPVTPGPAIEAEGLSRRFGTRLALDALDLSVARDTSFGLLGANGSGKTTFLRLLVGVLLPSAGRVRVAGRSPVSDARAVGRQLGYVPETARLYPELRVAGFLRFAGGARGLRGADLEAAVERVIERFGLGTVARRLIGQLSKGYRQRVSLAQALLHDPPLVIVDEPTDGLDPSQQHEVRAALAALAGERTLLVCTHDLAEARALCARVGVLRAGRLIAEGPASLLDTGDPLALFRPAGAAGDRAPDGAPAPP